VPGRTSTPDPIPWVRVSAPAISSRVQSSAPHTVGQELNIRFF
jgi:hypothetical protein